jgi:hypothetical protein
VSLSPPARPRSRAARRHFIAALVGRKRDQEETADSLRVFKDRALRDGDWKLVSYKSEPWELYNIAKDRTELNDVAAEHPDIVERMAAQWTDTARDVLRLPANAYRPVSEAPTNRRHPRLNPQWTDYSSAEASTTRYEANKRERRLERREKKGQRADEQAP